jgi:hypothetical protein
MGETMNFLSDLSEYVFLDEQVDGRVICSLILRRGVLRLRDGRK